MTELSRIKKSSDRIKKSVSRIKKSRLGRRSRTKGHSFEREIAILIRQIFPDARRHLEYQDAEANGVDLIGTGSYRIQCKRGKKYASLTAIEEVTADEALGEVPLLVTQGDHKRILVAMPIEEFTRLVTLAELYLGAV